MDNTAQIAELESRLGGPDTVSVDGLTSTQNPAEIRKRINELKGTDTTGTYAATTRGKLGRYKLG